MEILLIPSCLSNQELKTKEQRENKRTNARDVIKVGERNALHLRFLIDAHKYLKVALHPLKSSQWEWGSIHRGAG